ncbi:MAG: hypothetical protein N3A54_00985 [Patescibacteria group bacterium]|nr:hypothetical protein [Patescibacteria group bacterium]
MKKNKWTHSTFEKVFMKLYENLNVVVKKPQDALTRLTVKKTVEGDIMVDDDVDFYIFILPIKKKIVTIPKQYGEKFCTEKQVAFFDYLAKNGIVQPNMIQSGSLYGSFEVRYNDSAVEEGFLNMLLNVVADFIEEENEYRVVNIEDMKNRILRLVGRRDNETDPEEAVEREKQEVRTFSNTFGMSKYSNNTWSPTLGMYYYE